MEEPQKTPTRHTDFADENYTPAELEQIYERAAQLQSADDFAATDQGIDRDAVTRSAGRAGIGNKYVEQAINELRGEEKSSKARQIEAQQQTIARQKMVKKAAIPVAVVVGLFALLSYSLLNNKANDVEAKQAQLENVLQRRHDLIPNLIAASKVAASNEKEAFAKLSQLQKQSKNAAGFEEKLRTENELSGAVDEALNALPKSGSSNVFIRLSDEMSGAENRIAVERKRYNEAVQNYNHTAGGFPVMLFRSLFGFPARKPYFQAESGAAQTPQY